MISPPHHTECRPHDPDVLAAARQLGISAYDASYLELAMRLGADLATRDARLSAAAATAGVPLFATT